MCYSKPGPRCSGHTRTKFRESKAALVAATEDLKAKKEALESAKTDEARAELQASEKVLAEAKKAHETATQNYDKSKAKRAEAMLAYHQARDEYYSSPEGIKKNRQKAVDPNLTQEQRDQARQFAIEGQATRNQQTEAYAFQEALKEQEAKTSSAEATIPDVTQFGYHEQRILAKEESTDPRVLEALAFSKTSSEDGLIVSLSSDEVGDISRNVANNPSTSPKTLTKMFVSIRNADLSSDTQEAENNRAVLDGVAKNASTPASTLHEIASTGSLTSSTAAYLVANPNLPAEEATKLVDRYLTKPGFATHVGESSTAPVQIIERIALTDRLETSDSNFVPTRGAAMNPRISVETMLSAYHDKGCLDVLRNPRCPASILEHAYESKNKDAIRGILTNHNTPAHVMQKLNTAANRKFVLNHPNAPVEAFEKYSRHPDKNVRLIVARSKYTPSAVLKEMAGREITRDFRHAISGNPNFKG